METHGVFSPATEAVAREQYEDIGPVAQTVVKETAKAMTFDREEYGERVTSDVVATARDALFASLLETHTGTSEEFEADVPDDYEVHDGGERKRGQRRVARRTRSGIGRRRDVPRKGGRGGRNPPAYRLRSGVPGHRLISSRAICC